MYLRLENVDIIYPDFKIENFKLELERGDFFVLLGHSGSGKTTIIQTIAGFNEVMSGRVFLNNKDITNIPTHLRNIGIVFQDFALFPHLNVYENIAFSLKIKKKTKKEISKNVQELLEIIDLIGYEKRRINELSGGEKQRVSLARTLASKPDLILFDEPLSALDEVLRVKLRETIKDIQKKLKFTAIYVTHDQEEAFYLADKLGVMSKGQLVRFGLPESIYSDPQSSVVADFLGFKNKIKCIVEDKNEFFMTLRALDVSFKIRSNPLYNKGDSVVLLIKPSAGIFSDRVLSDNCFNVEIVDIKVFAAKAIIWVKIKSLVIEVKMNRSFLFDDLVTNKQKMNLNLPLEAFSILND